ncbi:MAG: dUTP diphosphatase [bacterium]
MINISKVYFQKLKRDASIPNKREEDGGMDLFPCFEDDYMVIEPHSVKLIPIGLASAFDSDYVALLRERGSTGTKNITVKAGVIDSGYRGEWFVAIGNDNDKPLIISKFPNDFDDEENVVYPYDKAIAQVVFTFVPKLEVEEIDNVKVFDSKRGEGKLGSTN